MTTIRKTTLALAVIAVAGCSSTLDRRNPDGSFDYAKVKLNAPLQVPAGLQAPKGASKYDIPTIKDPNAPVAKAVDIRAPSLVLTVVDGSRISEDEAGAKVEIDAREDQNDVVSIIHQRLDQWLKDKKIPVQSRTDKSIETGWFVPHNMKGQIQYADDFPVKRRFKITVDAPDHARSAEVHVSSIGAEKVSGADEANLTIGSGERASVAVLNDWLGYYAGLDKHKAKVVALAKYRPIAVTMGTNSSGLTAYKLDADFERAWGRVPMVLAHMGFEIKDIDKSLGTYYVSYSGNPEHSFWGSLFSSDDHKDLNIKHSKYQVQLGEVGEHTTSMTITDSDGQPIADDKYKEIFTPFTQLMGDSGLKEIKK